MVYLYIFFGPGVVIGISVVIGLGVVIGISVVIGLAVVIGINVAIGLAVFCSSSCCYCYFVLKLMTNLNFLNGKKVSVGIDYN